MRCGGRVRVYSGFAIVIGALWWACLCLQWISYCDWCVEVCVSVVYSGFAIVIGAAVMSLVSIGALKVSGRQYPLNYICLAVFVSLSSFTLTSVIAAYVE